MQENRAEHAKAGDVLKKKKKGPNGCAEHGAWTDPAVIRKPPVNQRPLDFSLIDKEENQRILAAGKMSFAMVGCSGDPDTADETTAVAKAMSADKNLSFFYHLGDIIYSPVKGKKIWLYDDTEPLGGSVPYTSGLWQKEFYKPYAVFPKKIISIAGNHDGKYKDSKSATPLGDYFKNFCSQGSERAAQDKRAPMNQPHIYWRLDTPFAFIIGLYANIANAGILDDPKTYKSANFTSGPQYKWLVRNLKAIAEINKSSTPRKAVLLAVHYPPYSGAANFDVRGDPRNGGPATKPNSYDAPYLAVVLQKAFSESGQRPDAIFSAHAHLYQRLTYSFADGTVMPCLVVGCGGHIPVEQLLKKCDGTVALAPLKPWPAVRPGDFQFPPGEKATVEKFDDKEHGNHFSYLQVTVDSKAHTLTCQFAATGDSCRLNLDTHKYAG